MHIVYMHVYYHYRIIILIKYFFLFCVPVCFVPSFFSTTIFNKLATWVSRYASDENLIAVEEIDKGGKLKDLAPIQRDKFSHFFTYLLDHDRDGFINRKDFRMLSEVYITMNRRYYTVIVESLS